MTNGSDLFPGFDRFLQDNPAWLDEAVPTNEASRITGVPACTLAVTRRRSSVPEARRADGSLSATSLIYLDGQTLSNQHCRSGP